MTKVSAKKQKNIMLKVDADLGQLQWNQKLLPIECIKEIRSSADARYYREQFQLSQDHEPRWLTIIYVLDGKYKTMHLVAHTRDVFQMWDITLRKLHAVRKALMSGLGNHELRQTIWEKHYWKSSDQEADQKLDFEEVEKMCRRLNVNAPSEDLLRLFRQADTEAHGYLNFSDFKHFVKALKARPEIDRLYRKLRTENKRGQQFDLEVFSNFMQQVQKTTLSVEELRVVFNKYATIVDLLDETDDYDEPSRGPTSSWTYDAFAVFLMGPDNSALLEHHSGVWQDMSLPLSDYYISSSHNTYLVGNQLMGDSTIEGYIRALLHGCRSVEVDIYDGEVEPMIFHGKTLTSKVSLRNVCEAIFKYGFITTDYPIIISAEVHCGVAQQDMIAQIMREVFGDALVTAPVHGRPKIEVLPSPTELKGCILMKTKNLFIVPKGDTGIGGSDSALADTSSTSESDPVMSPFEQDDDSPQNQRNNALSPDSGQPNGHRRSFSNGVRPQALLSTKTTALVRRLSSQTRSRVNIEPPKVKMSFALVALLVYTVGVKFRGINKKEDYAPEHMFSLSENNCSRLIRQGMLELLKHNRTHLTRIYPRGTRLQSTNFEPHRFWATGAQLVAINWQTFDLGYMLNHAMFQRNGRCGYVLKPLALRTSGKHLLSQLTRHHLDVTVISAQQLPRPKNAMGREKVDKSTIDPFVEVSLHIPDWTQPRSNDPQPLGSIPFTQSSNATLISARTLTYRTGIVKNNGFNPVWQHTIRFQFDCVGGMKDLIFLRFAVKAEDKEDEEPLASYCASLGNSHEGYRHLPLHDVQLSQYLFSTLFVHLSLHDIP